MFILLYLLNCITGTIQVTEGRMLARLHMARSVTQRTGITKASFILNTSHGFTMRAWMLFNLRSSLGRYSQNSKNPLQDYVQIPFTEFRLQPTIKLEKLRQKIVYGQRHEAWCSLRLLTRDSQELNTFQWTFALPDVFESGEECRKCGKDNGSVALYGETLHRPINMGNTAESHATVIEQMSTEL
jgi:hypothetical protein